MARLFGIMAVLLAVYTAFDYALSLAPQPEEAVASTEGDIEEDPVDAPRSDGSGPDRATVPPSSPEPTGEGLAAGIYVVGDSPDRRIAADDGDFRSRVPVFGAEDDRDITNELRRRRSGLTTSGPDDLEDLEDEVDIAAFVDEDPRLAPSLDPARRARLPEQGEIVPGFYATSFDTEGCTYELWRVLNNGLPEPIGEEFLSSGRVLVMINGIEPDWFVSSPECGPWHRWTPLDEPLTLATNGDYWIGDLAAGTWKVPEGCRWEKVVGFRGARLADVEETAHGPQSLTIDEETLGVSIRGCTSPIELAIPATIAGV